MCFAQTRIHMITNIIAHLILYVLFFTKKSRY